MPERFLPRAAHAVTKPFVEGRRRVRQVSNDILDGGRRKRIDAQYGGPITGSTLRDFSRATAPMALFFATVGFSIPLFVDIIGEFAAEANMAPPPGDVNWLVPMLTAAGGLLVGGIANAEHSRRVGKEWRLESQEYRSQYQRFLEAMSPNEQTPSSS